MKTILEKMQVKETRLIKDKKVKALRVIDMLITNTGKEENELLSLIYRISHSASGICNNPHKDWIAEIDSVYDKLMKTGE